MGEVGFVILSNNIMSNLDVSCLHSAQHNLDFDLATLKRQHKRRKQRCCLSLLRLGTKFSPLKLLYCVGHKGEHSKAKIFKSLIDFFFSLNTNHVENFFHCF